MGVIIILALVLALGAGALLFCQGGRCFGMKQTSTGPSPSPVEMARVTAPSIGAKVTSPFTITGEAPGSWYFEAVFPVKLKDAKGTVIAEGQAKAQGDWMTAEYVPFEAMLTFSAPATPAGLLVLEKDNPSGLPENAASIVLPVRF